MLWYPINVYTSQLNDDVSNNSKTIADLSGARKWAEILDYFKDNLRGSNLDRINPHFPSGPVHPYQLDESISNF